MNWAGRTLRKFQILFRREQFNTELDEEMAFHRDEAIRQFEAEGMTPDLARYAAARQFGNTTLLKERSHEMVGFRFESVVQDLRFAVRQLRKNPGFTLTAILMLALGMGASVAIFAFVDAALIKPLPFPNPSRLAGVHETSGGRLGMPLSYDDYRDWKRMNTVFQSLDVWVPNGYLLKNSAGVQPTPGIRVSAGMFRTLGVQPMLGRDFHDGEDAPGAPLTVILSYGGWQKWFGGKPDVIGQTVSLSGLSYTVIGVMPREFQFAPRGRADFWTALQPLQGCDVRRSCHGLNGVGRLKDGVSVQAADANMKSIALGLERLYPGSNRGQGASIQVLSESVVGDIRPILLVLLGGAALLLLIACVNVSSLLLARSENRRREMAVRGALGASKARLIRQFVTESLALVVLGSVLGVLAAYGGMRLLLTLVPADMLEGMPYLEGLGMNARVPAFAVAVALLAAVVFSVMPALRFSQLALREDLSEGGRGSASVTWRRFGSNLVVLELAIAMVLLVGAGLLGKSFYRLVHVDIGFQPDHLAMLSVALPDASYSKDGQVAAAKEIVRHIEQLPGVTSAGISSMAPVTCNCNTDWIRFVGKPYNGEHNEVNERDVSPAYFATLQAKLLRGRFFTDGDEPTKPSVILINQALAKKYFPGEDPIGRKVGDGGLTPNSLREIVGVVDDVREGSLDTDLWPVEYFPFSQNSDTYFTVVVRTDQAAQSVLPSVVAAIHKVDPGIGTMDEMTMIGHINDSQTAYLHRSSAWLVGGFAALALLLGVVGLYGVIAYSVSQRTREIGVRMALGAQRSAVYRLILTEAGWLTVIGIVAGGCCSIVAGILMQKLLFQVRSWDVPTLFAVGAVLATAAAMASYLPARRAASVNPVEALRAE
jgi:macrolide transport system ATP-binding/permease protein